MCVGSPGHEVESREGSVRLISHVHFPRRIEIAVLHTHTHDGSIAPRSDRLAKEYSLVISEIGCAPHEAVTCTSSEHAMSISPQPSMEGVSPSSQRSGYFPPLRSSSYALQQRRGSNASATSLPSIGGSLDIRGRRNNVVQETASQNAISTLLQPPIVRTGLLPHTAASTAAAGYKAPTTKDIPPVALTNIPHVPQENFRDYLQRIGPLFESFQRGRIEPEQPQWLKKDKELEKTDRFAEALERRMSQSSTAIASPTSALSPTTPGGQPRRRRSSITFARRNRNEPTPLSTIPPVYFDENFHLENPRTFDIVSERAEIVRPPPGTPQQEQKGANGVPLPPRKALATNAILQEKLSWYMDTVEVHLINNISSASSGFFAALGSLRELQTEAEESVKRIQALREDLRRLDEEVAVAGLEVAAKKRRRANIGRLARATRQVQAVVEEVKRADKLVDDGEFEEAAVGMERVGRLVCGESEEVGGKNVDELIDLRRLKALQGLDSGLQELQLRIGTGFANRFTALLMSDLRQHIEKVPPTDTMKRWARQRGIPPTYMETSTAFRKDLLAAIKGLQKAGHIAPATAAYREAVTKEIKSLIRKHLPSSTDDDADSMISTTTSVRSGKLSQQEKSTILARNLRALEAEDAERMLVGVYSGVGEALRRVGTQTKVVLDLQTSGDAGVARGGHSRAGSLANIHGGHSRANSLAIIESKTTAENGTLSPPASSSGPASDELSQALDLSNLVGQAVDTAQTQITRVLKVRNEQIIRLPRERFLRYFSLNRLFADECEAVSGRGGQALKGIINAQISGFIQVLGTQETEKIATLLDSDAWNSRDFSEADDALLKRILGAMGSDPPEWTKGIPPVWEDASPNVDGVQANGETNGTATPNGQPTAPTKSTTTAKPAYIDDNRYILVPSVIALLPTIETFLSLTASIPSFTPQISTSLLDVLRTFNSRSCQLILGAGATRSAGLKNITTKHLALASQALSFIIALVPYLRECVRRHLPAGQTNVLAEFDKTKRLYQDHQSGIHDKLVEIMTTRSQAHVKALLAIDFAADTKVDDEKASPYMETLTKETLTLHRVLSKHLSEVDVMMIMRQIGEAYQEQWSKAFSDAAAKLPKAEGKAEEGAAQKRLVKDAEIFASRLGKIEGFESVGAAVVGVARKKVEDSGEEKKEEEGDKKG